MWRFLEKVVVKWMESNAFIYAASLSYNALFSTAPILLITTGLAGLFLGQKAAEGQILEKASGIIGASSAQLIQDLIQKASIGKGNILATLLGILLLVLSATAIFAQIKYALNDIWQVAPASQASKFSGVVYFLKTRLSALLMLFILGLFLVGSLAATAVLGFFGDLIHHYLKVPSWILQEMNSLLSLLILALFFTLLFKMLPDVRLRWRDVFPGAALTSLLFLAAKYLISLYITRGPVSGVYGASASLVVILLWVYFSSLILFLGAAFTQVYVRTFGPPVKLAENTVWKGPVTG